MPSYTASGATGNGYTTINLYIEQQSQDMAANTSTIYYALYLYKSGSSTSGSWDGSTGSYNISIDGNTIASGTLSGRLDVTPGQTTVIAYGTITISHLSDGQKWIEFSGSISGKGKLSGSCSGALTLDTILRESTVTVGSTFEIGKAGTITIHSQSSSFWHKVRYRYGATTGSWHEVGSGSTNTVYTFPASEFSSNLADYTPNSVQGNGSIDCQTWSGNTYIAQTSCTFYLTVPSSMKVTVNDFTDKFDIFSDAASIATKYPNLELGSIVGYEKHPYLANFSQIKVTVTDSFFNTSNSHGATPYWWSVRMNGTSIDKRYYTDSTGIANEITMPVISGTDVTIRIDVQDTRGYQDKRELLFSSFQIPYSPPTISSWYVQRYADSAYETLDTNGDFLKGFYSYEVSPINNKNTVTMKALIRRHSETITYDWAALIDETTLTEYSGIDVEVGTKADQEDNIYSNDLQYDIRFILTDGLGLITYYDFFLPSLLVTLDIREDGLGMGIGKIAESGNDGKNLLDLAWALKVAGVDEDGVGLLLSEGALNAKNGIRINDVTMSNFLVYQHFDGANNAWSYMKWDNGLVLMWCYYVMNWTSDSTNNVSTGNSNVMVSMPWLGVNLSSPYVISATIMNNVHSASELKQTVKATAVSSNRMRLSLESSYGDLGIGTTIPVGIIILGREASS